MKALIKPILYVGAGLVTGSVTTYFIVRGLFQKQCDEAVEEAWAMADDYYHEIYLKKYAAKERAEKNREMKKEREETKEQPSKGKKEPDPEENNSSTFDIKSFRKKATKTVQSYRRNVFTNPPDDRDIWIAEEGDADDYKEDDHPHEALYRDEPYVIDDDQFVNENPYWDKLTLYVYTDGTVRDEQGKLVDDIDACVGSEIMSKREELADNYGAILVRNEMRSTDYELLLVYEPYNDEAPQIRDD